MVEIGTATDYRDLLAKLDTFLTTTGSAFGLTYAGTGNGALTAYKGGASSIAETFVITATSSTSFNVVGSTSGSIGPATVGTPFSHAKLAFLISAGGVAFVAGDVFTLQTAPKWTGRRQLPGCTMALSSGSGAGGSSGQFSFENLIDGKDATSTGRYWTASTLPKLVEFNFPSAITVVEYSMLGYFNNANGPTAWTFEYWNGSAWTVLDTRSGQTFATSELKVLTITSPVSAARYRLNITAGNSPCNLQAVQLHTAAGGIDVAMSQYLWEAPGNDGAGGILVGVRSFQRADVAYYDWELCAFDGFTAALPFFSQTGMQRNLFLPLANSSIPYWFIADGRRVLIVAKVGSSYETAYLGFLEPYFTPAQLPYPLVMAGTLALGDTMPTWESTGFQVANATNRHRSIVHSDSEGGSTLGRATLRARRLDGTWAPFFATSVDTQVAEAAGWIWPYNTGYTGGTGVNNVDVNPDGSYALFPVSLMDSQPNTWGQLAGVSFVTGQGLSAEDLIAVGPIKHLAVPNITRIDRNDFLAVRLD